MRGRALEDSGRRAGLLEGVFIACVRRVVSALRLQHAGALSTPVQAGGEQETIGAPLGRAVRKSGGPRGSSPFVPLSYSLDSQIDFTLQQGCSTGRHRTPPERCCMCLLMTCRCLQLSRSGILLQNIRYHGSTGTHSAVDIQSYMLVGPGQNRWMLFSP